MEDNSKNRVVRWTQKLLDLSLRNRLLNARDSKQILPLAVDGVASLPEPRVALGFTCQSARNGNCGVRVVSV